MDINRICINCLRRRERAEGTCEYCGFDSRAYQTPNFALPKYTILNGNYLICRVLGAGGFGITYLAYDLNLECPVAIKEYYVRQLMYRDSSRDTRVSASLYSPQEGALYNGARERFEKEAKVLAKCGDLPGIVNVRTFFQENNTAYIVMDYLQGQNLKEYVEENGALGWNETIRLLHPVMTSLQSLHEQGIIHRDISPDNMVFSKNGELRLIDFGGVKQNISGGSRRSSMVLMKDGYTPLEQISNASTQGPWSDVFAMAATIAFCIGGKTPAPVTTWAAEQLPDALSVGGAITKQQEAVLKEGMAAHLENRYQSMQEFLNAIDSVTGKGRGRGRQENRAESGMRSRVGDSYSGASGGASEKKHKKAGSTVIGFLLCLLLLALCGGGYVAWQKYHSPTVYVVTVTRGSADQESYQAGETVYLQADAAKEGEGFWQWEVTAGDVALTRPDLELTSFSMPAEDVSVAARFKEETEALAEAETEIMTESMAEVGTEGLTDTETETQTETETSAETETETVSETETETGEPARDLTQPWRRELPETVDLSGLSVRGNYFTYEGHILRMLRNDAYSWYDMALACELLGGHLATVETKEKSDWIAHSFLSRRLLDESTSIGLTRRTETGDWAWVDGTYATYFNWYPGEPNNSGGAEPFGEIVGGTDQWNDIGEWLDNGSEGKYFLCEWDSKEAYAAANLFGHMGTEETPEEEPDLEEPEQEEDAWEPEVRYDYPFAEVNEWLPYWGADVDGFNIYVRDEDHPDGEDTWHQFTNVKVTSETFADGVPQTDWSGEPISEEDAHVMVVSSELRSNGTRYWHLEGRQLGQAEVTFTYPSVSGTLERFTCTFEILPDLYQVNFTTDTGCDFLLPGDTMDITVNLTHSAFSGEDWFYEIPVGEMEYTWRIPDEYARYLELTVDEADPATAHVRAKTLAEVNREEGEDTAVDAAVCILVTETDARTGETAIVSRQFENDETWFWLHDYPFYVQVDLFEETGERTDLSGLTVGKTGRLSPVINEYWVDEDGTRHCEETRRRMRLRWEFDPNAVTITDDNGEILLNGLAGIDWGFLFTDACLEKGHSFDVLRRETWGTDIWVIAQDVDKDGAWHDVANRWISLPDCYRGIWFEDRNNGDNAIVYSDGTTQFWVNTSELEADETDYEIRWEIGRGWDENGELAQRFFRDWYTISGNTISFDGAKMMEVAEITSDWYVDVVAKIMVHGHEVARTSCMVELREAE